MTDSPLASAEWLALVAAMRFSPDDDTPRLVGADWLQETNRPELIAWGEFVRWQVEGARENRSGHKYTDSCNCKPCACERRALALYDRYSLHWSHHTWAGADVVRSSPPADRYARGFVQSITVQHTAFSLSPVPKIVPPLFDRQPIRCVMAHINHTHPTRFPDRFVLGVVVDPAVLFPGQIVVTARISRAERPAVSVDRHRPASTPKQFPGAVGGAIRHAIKDRSALNV